MPINDDLRKTLSDPTPLYALAGVGDLAVTKLREVPEKAATFAATDRTVVQERATARLKEAQVRLTEAQTKVSATVSGLPGDFKSLQEKAQDFALQSVGRAAEMAVKARGVYDELAERGKVAVDRQRKEAADDLVGIAGKAESKADAFAAEVDQIADEAADKATDVAAEVEPDAHSHPKPGANAKRTMPRKNSPKD
jgi:polyhydroxyalkanoate synthesis regulator phasin